MDYKEHQYLTMQEAAWMAKLSYAAFHHHVERGTAPEAIWIGKRRFYTKESILNWDRPKRGRPKLTEDNRPIDRMQRITFCDPRYAEVYEPQKTAKAKSPSSSPPAH